MKPTVSLKCNQSRFSLSTSLVVALVCPVLFFGFNFFFSGCGQSLVYQRPVSELNLKAQQLLEAGDYEGAIARLESAHDLQPDNDKTTYNLATAYQLNNNIDQAIGLFTQLLQKNTLGQGAELEKSLGIVYEAKADALMQKFAEFENKANTPLANSKNLDNKPDQQTNSAMSENDTTTDASQLKPMAINAYKLAIQYYQAAMQSAERPDIIQKQIDTLTDTVNKLSSQQSKEENENK
ncbi:MAG: tetratricopeptide repeat protein [Cyanobacteria bacterium P01_H01_bin.74]